MEDDDGAVGSSFILADDFDLNLPTFSCSLISLSNSFLSSLSGISVMLGYWRRNSFALEISPILMLFSAFKSLGGFFDVVKCSGFVPEEGLVWRDGAFSWCKE